MFDNLTNRASRWAVFGIAGLMALSQVGCARQTSHTMSGEKATSMRSPRPAPIWSVQLNYTPNTASQLSLQYDSPGDPYNSAVAAPPGSHLAVWMQRTWKLTNVAFNAAQNGGADLRIVGGGGIAVHSIALALTPPAKGGSVASQGPSASITFAAGGSGSNIESNMTQVLSGGNTADSHYATGTVGQRSAEIMQGGISYIYLRLHRRSKIFQAHPKVVYVTVTYAATRAPVPWSEKTFAHLAARGIHRAEINLAWGMIEPRHGDFNFTLLDQTLANAAKAHVRVIPIFWYSLWSGNPPFWIKRYDQFASGDTSVVPIWWSRFNRNAYFLYVTEVISHLAHNPGFGGAFLNFGWLDYMWGPAFNRPNNVNGYAPENVARFHRWLPSRYHSLAAFNRRYHTHYSAWTAIPAQAYGQPLFSVYQHFRNWSVFDTYQRLTAMVRQETDAPLFYYWGGGFSGAGVAFNLPDTFFQLAQKYHVTVCDDNADHAGNLMLFGSLADAYKVPLFEEWTPEPTGLHAEITQFLGHYGFEMPQSAGMDFFLYHGGHVFKVGYPAYVHWLPVLKQIHGYYPSQPVAVYISYRSIFKHPTSLSNLPILLAAIWRKLHVAFTLVTNREIKAGVIHLKDFRAVYPINGRHDPEIAAYAAHGGKVLSNANELARYAPAYATLTPADSGMEIVPTVSAKRTSGWITLSPWRLSHRYDGVITLHRAALELRPGPYHLVDAETGKTVQPIGKDGLKVRLQIKRGQLKVWKIVPGKD